MSTTLVFTGTRSTTVLGVFQGGAQIDNQLDIIFGEASRIADVRSDLLNVVIIADSSAVSAYSLNQVADYMAMLALTRASQVGCNRAARGVASGNPPDARTMSGGRPAKVARHARLPDWQVVTGRDYHGWDRAHSTIDTSGRSVAQCIEEVVSWFD